MPETFINIMSNHHHSARRKPRIHLDSRLALLGSEQAAADGDGGGVEGGDGEGGDEDGDGELLHVDVLHLS